MQPASVLNIEDELSVFARGTPTLSPAQSAVATDLSSSLAAAEVAVLRVPPGMGRTTVLKAVYAQTGGEFVIARQFLSLLSKRSPEALEETLLELLGDTLDRNDVVLVDDFHLLMEVMDSFNYTRANLVNAVMTAILDDAARQSKKVIFGLSGENETASIRNRAVAWEMEDFEAEDYSVIAQNYLGSAAARLDMAKVYRFAPTLTAYQIKHACLWLGLRHAAPTTDSFIDYLRSRNISSNVDLEEVEPVDLTALKGVEDVLQELEAKVALPFENDKLAAEFQLKPKRGVLLAGPPGTGKTSIGRALAHRLKGKFFLIDGTVNSGKNDFYSQVEKVFDAARRNAPAVIFIDDADVIFEAGNQGLYRYLLTMLDGLESASSERVCVMMTAMNAASLPRALLRSGRIELWLNTRLPDEAARATILRDKLGLLPPPVNLADVPLLARESKGLSGADLKLVVEEGKLLYAHAISMLECTEAPESYFLRAIRTCRDNRRNYGKSSSRAEEGPYYGFPL